MLVRIPFAKTHTTRKRGRVVDCTGLENRQRATVREFESHRFRQVNRLYRDLETFSHIFCSHHFFPSNPVLTLLNVY